ncbi:tyrosinase family protein [Paenibacillus antri]|nr:tyrosinase family protein [Paenibacillus antri]
MNLRPGDGIEFLRFHRNFLRKSLRWYNAQGLNPKSVEPWSSIPVEIKTHPGWTSRLQEAENRITRNLASFESSDELGIFLLTSSLHDAVHAIGAEVYSDMDFGQIRWAPRSTLFFNWHGMIDRRWRAFQRIKKSIRRSR